MAELKKEANLRSVNLIYTSAINFTKSLSTIIIAIDENSLYPCLAIISCVKEKLSITGCTINSCNTQILKDKSACNLYEILKQYEDKIRLIYESGEKECIIFESDIKHKLISKLEAL